VQNGTSMDIRVPHANATSVMTNSCSCENCWKAIEAFNYFGSSLYCRFDGSLCEFWLKTWQPAWRQWLWAGQTMRPGDWAVWLWPTSARPRRSLGQKIGRRKGLEISTAAAAPCNTNSCCDEQASCRFRTNEKWHFATRSSQQATQLITKLIATASAPFIFIIFIV